MPTIDEALTSAEEALDTAAREFTKHSGPGSMEHERAIFRRDLQVAAKRYAKAYEDHAFTCGLVANGGGA